MSMQLETVTAGEIADLLGWSRAHFLRKRSEIGFPAALPAQRNLRWARRAVENWFEAWSVAKTREAASELRANLVDRDRKILMARYSANQNEVAA
ncbi:hypothetical protein FJU08_01235 [Martelella alba]|uniref:Transcriptional regulator, AlpA family n=1 Tax=Martelella alba TaxID=2590451 RepID=A0A506UIS4_9HYPH|nr:hypothetical protein [Martelella alba]TPW33217.1 hypothetical protein FJU08_01235 [Martelella alba]